MLANMRERLKQLTAVTALVLVAGGSLVACSDEKDPPKTDGAGGSATDALTKANFLDEITQAVSDAGTSHVKMSANIAGQDVEADGDLEIGDTPTDSAMAMTMKTGQPGLGALESRLIDEVFYINLGPMTGNKFTKIDLKDKNNPIGQQYGELVGKVDPAQQFKQFEGAVKSFDAKGKAITLDGVKAQPYVMIVDPSKMSAADKAGASAAKSLEYTMYIGPDNLPRRFISEVPGGAGGTMTIDYSKWGDAVSITAPKASEITKKDIFSQLGGPTPEGS
jgi:hypothetical protein